MSMLTQWFNVPKISFLSFQIYSFFKRGYILLFANIFYVLANLGVIKIFLLYDKSSWVGDYALVTSIITPFILLTNFQIKNLTIAHERSIYHISDYFSARILASITLVVIIFFIYTISILATFQTTSLLLTVCFYKIIESFSDFTIAGLQSKKKTVVVSISILVRSLILLSTALLCIYFKNCIIGFFIGGLVLFLWNLIYEWRWFIKINKYVYVKSLILFKRLNGRSLILKHVIKTFKIIKTVIPLGIISMLTSYSVNITRYMIGIMLDTEKVGIYTSVSYLWYASCFLCITIGEIYLSNASEKLKSGEHLFFISSFKNYAYFSIFVGILGLIITVFAGPAILQLIFDETYSKYIGLLFLFIVFVPISYVNYFLSINLTLFGCYYNQLISNIIVNIMLIPCCYYLITLFDINGSIISLITLSLLQVFYFTYLYFKNILIYR